MNINYIVDRYTESAQYIKVQPNLEEVRPMIESLYKSGAYTGSANVTVIILTLDALFEASFRDQNDRATHNRACYAVWSKNLPFFKDSSAARQVMVRYIRHVLTVATVYMFAAKRHLDLKTTGDIADKFLTDHMREKDVPAYTALKERLETNNMTMDELLKTTSGQEVLFDFKIKELPAAYTIALIEHVIRSSSKSLFRHREARTGQYFLSDVIADILNSYFFAPKESYKATVDAIYAEEVFTVADARARIDSLKRIRRQYRPEDVTRLQLWLHNRACDVANIDSSCRGTYAQVLVDTLRTNVQAEIEALYECIMTELAPQTTPDSVVNMESDSSDAE